MKIGDKVFYPMHGAGVIESIEQNEVGGITKSYYILKMPIGNLKLMLPTDRIDQMGLREIIDSETVAKVENVLRSKAEHTQGSWNKRFHATLERMKNGDILDVAAVARNLSLQHRKRKISSGERRLLDLSRQILISELVFACNKTPEEVIQWMDTIIGCNKTDENFN